MFRLTFVFVPNGNNFQLQKKNAVQIIKIHWARSNIPLLIIVLWYVVFNLLFFIPSQNDTTKFMSEIDDGWSHCHLKRSKRSTIIIFIFRFSTACIQWNYCYASKNWLNTNLNPFSRCLQAVSITQWEKRIFRSSVTLINNKIEKKIIENQIQCNGNIEHRRHFIMTRKIQIGINRNSLLRLRQSYGPFNSMKEEELSSNFESLHRMNQTERKT